MKSSTCYFLMTMLALSFISTGCASLLNGAAGGGGGIPNVADLLNKVPIPPGLNLSSNYEQAMSQLPYLAVSKGTTVADGADLYGNQNFR